MQLQNVEKQCIHEAVNENCIKSILNKVQTKMIACQESPLTIEEQILLSKLILFEEKWIKLLNTPHA